jgi:hypothetical protein
MTDRDDMLAAAREQLRFRMPGLKKGLGAGDVVKKVTESLGIESCDECEKRRLRLNRWLRLEGREDEISEEETHEEAGA